MAAQILEYLLILIAAAAALILPGAAWQAWRPAGADEETDAAQRLADTIGLSVSFTALVALAAFLLGLHFSPVGLVCLYAGLAVATVTGRARRSRGRFWTFGSGLALTLFALGLVTAWRLYQARSLALPAWVDSVHHVLIVQVMLDKGGLPGDLAPYLPVPFYYHYGFHILAAVFSFFSRLAPERAVLILGQGLNALVCLSVYRLGMALWKDVRRAGAAALLVAFAFHMPAYYLTWGRYTLLAGLVILPVAMAAAVEAARQETLQPERALRLAWLTGGLFLTHYLAALLFGLFLVVLGLGKAWEDFRRRTISWGAWSGLVGGVLLGTVLAAPWLMRIWQYSTNTLSITPGTEAGAAYQGPSSGYVSYLWYLAGPYRNHVLFGLAGLALLFALRRAPGRLIGAWTLILVSLAVPWTIRLGPFRPDHLVIVLFLPAALLLGDLLVSAGEAAGRVLRRRWDWAPASIAVLALCVWGVIETRDILNSSTLLADTEDVTAVQWVAAHTPADAHFLLNDTYWQGNVYRGVDGGWWIQPLTGRETVPPPVVYTWGKRDYVQQMTGWAKQASQLTACGAEFWRLVREAQIGYLYLHDGKGGMKPQVMSGCAGLEPVYQAGEVWIYRVTPTPGE